MSGLVAAFAQAPLRVMLVTGGHDHEPTFYSAFIGQKDFVTNVNPHPVAYKNSLAKYDVIVLYDMVQEIPDAQKANLKAFAESGKGLVVLHHALVSFSEWPWYRELVGGQYLGRRHRLTSMTKSWTSRRPSITRLREGSGTFT